MVIHCENFGEITNTFIQSTEPASPTGSRHGDGVTAVCVQPEHTQDPRKVGPQLPGPETESQWGLPC